MVHGFEVESLEGPYFVGRGQFTITGNITIDAFTLLKRETSIVSGLWGVSGVYRTQYKLTAYNDISGISGCVGCTIEKKWADDQTGGVQVFPMYRKQVGVLHFGFVKLPYVSGLIDNSVVVLKWGDKLAPCISGFRALEPLQSIAVLTPAASAETTGYTYGTGLQQCELGTYADLPSTMTGTSGAARYRILLNPKTIYGGNE